MEMAVETPTPCCASRLAISVVIPPERDMMPTLPGTKLRAVSAAGPPTLPTFVFPGEMRPMLFGPMTRTPSRAASSTTCAASSRGTRSVTMTTSGMP